MKLRLLKIYDILSDSFWFLPTVMAILAIVAALFSVRIDINMGEGWVHSIKWIWSGGPDGARSVLSIVAGSLMTVTSIVFSLTITTLAQTSSHFGPRILRNFTSDRGVQFTLGTFIATFVYCLLVLRTVRSVEETMFVPYLSVNIGLGLTLASLAILIYFIHHVAQMIQVENLIAVIGQDFQNMLPTFFPASDIKIHSDQTLPNDDYWQNAAAIDATNTGYLQQTDVEQLTYLATQHNLQLKIMHRPGDFLSNGTPLMQAMPPEHVTSEIKSALRECFSFGNNHTPLQDPLFLMQQLVEIAAHALSPGINEPFTAQGCIVWLGAALRGIAKRDVLPAMRYDEKGKWRVLADPLDFNEFVHAAFDQIRLYGANNPAVMISLINTITSLAPDLHRTTDRAVMMQHLQLIRADIIQILNLPDRERVIEKLQGAQRALAAPGSSTTPKSEYE